MAEPPVADVYKQMYIAGMAQRYSIAEARSSLPAIIDQAASGQAVELTRRGTPVAVVVSVRQFEGLRRRRTGFAEAYRRFLETHALDAVGVDEDFAASLRAHGAGRRVSL